MLEAPLRSEWGSNSPSPILGGGKTHLRLILKEFGASMRVEKEVSGTATLLLEATGGKRGGGGGQGACGSGGGESGGGATGTKV